MKKNRVKIIAVLFVLFTMSAPVSAEPPIIGRISADASGQANAGGSSGVQTFTESQSWVTGNLRADGNERGSEYKSTAGFDHYSRATHSNNNGESGVWSNVRGNANISIVPPSLRNHGDD